METETTYVSLQEAAKLELKAADQRLARARAALADFVAEHTMLVDGREAWKETRAELVHGLWRQRHELEIELDEAFRVWQKALGDFRAFLPKPTQLAPGPARR